MSIELGPHEILVHLQLGKLGSHPAIELLRRPELILQLQLLREQHGTEARRIDRNRGVRSGERTKRRRDLVRCEDDVVEQPDLEAHLALRGGLRGRECESNRRDLQPTQRDRVPCAE